MTDIRSKTKDMNSRIESGVAGRSMAGKLSLPQRDHVAEVRYGSRLKSRRDRGCAQWDD